MGSAFRCCYPRGLTEGHRQCGLESPRSICGLRPTWLRVYSRPTASPPNATSESDAAKYLTAALLYERTNAAAGAGAMRAMTAIEDIEIARFRGMREEK
jgi:hypothetical protein